MFVFDFFIPKWQDGHITHFELLRKIGNIIFLLCVYSFLYEGTDESKIVFLAALEFVIRMNTNEKWKFGIEIDFIMIVFVFFGVGFSIYDFVTNVNRGLNIIHWGFRTFGVSVLGIMYVFWFQYYRKLHSDPVN